MRVITIQKLELFKEHLVNEEKAVATINKYVHDVEVFVRWLSDSQLDKCAVLAYKKHLAEHYEAASVNVALSALNSFFVLWNGTI